jgi:hypothetical protein
MLTSQSVNWTSIQEIAVTLTKEYAKDHGEHALKGHYKILSKKVRAKDLWTNADSIHEFGFNPNP